ncbi:MAG: IPT/TIG domain-containing protein, partial [Parcubacteria group bacterium]|nr:IPT/TIG domain-containing protein [Parcubacteria group bacterium]
MNKIIVTVVVFGFLLSSVALAHEEVGNIGLLPDSPLYFLKALSEKIKLSFTFSSPRRIQHQWELADRRLREIEALTAKGKGELVPKLFEKYGALVDQAQKRLEDVVGRGQDVGNLRTFVSEMREKHVEVLEEVLIQVPESAKDAIQRVVQRAESQLPVIESISPASGKVGALVTLVGSNFSPVGNTVSFAGVSGTGSGYLNDVKSADGSMLQFNVPEGLDVCISPPVGTAYCLGYAQLRPDSYEIAVISVRGKSNSVSFTVLEGMVPIESPVTTQSAKISR